MVFAYFKDGIDTDAQEKQIDKIKFFANVHGFSIGCYLRGRGEQICWASDGNKENSLFKRVEKGDTIILPEAICLGKGFSEVMTVLARLLKNKAHLFLEKEGYSFDDEHANLNKAEAFMLAVDIEKELKRDSSKKAIALRRRSGKRIGHPFGIGRVHNMSQEDMDLLLNSDISLRDIVIKKLGISKSSYYTYRRKHRKMIE